MEQHMFTLNEAAFTQKKSSIIPPNGLVISGHGFAKKWINDNLKIGTKVSVLDRTIRAYTTVDSYRYQAKAKIKQYEAELSELKEFKKDYKNGKSK